MTSVIRGISKLHYLEETCRSEVVQLPAEVNKSV